MGDLFAGPVTPAAVKEARTEMAGGLLTATAVVGAVSGLNYRFNAPGGGLLQEALKGGVTGVSATPTPSGRAAIRIPRGSIITALLPAPVGYVPAEAYGLRPDFWIQQTGSFPGAEIAGFVPSQTRLSVADAKVAADALALRAFGGGSQAPGQYSPNAFLIPPGRIPLTRSDVVALQRVPPGLSDLTDLVLPQLERRLSDLLPSPPSNPIVSIPEFSGPSVPVGGLHNPTIQRVALEELEPDLVALGSTQPTLVRPSNGNAIRNAAAATGIRRDLATERLDP